MKKTFLLLSITLLLLQSCSSENSSNENNNSSTYSFSQGGIITDIDGNSYPTIVTNCSNQVWMQKNLNVSHYRNGDLIPQVTDPTAWGNLTTGAWCYYNNDAANGIVYGKLYNWYAVNDSRGLAPVGYHIPTKAEWTIFINCLEGEFVAGGKMKETGISHWNDPNTAATNESGFTGLPGSSRDIAIFGNIGTYAKFWSSSEQNSSEASGYFMNYGTSACFSIYENKKNGFSVRCIKN